MTFHKNAKRPVKRDRRFSAAYKNPRDSPENIKALHRAKTAKWIKCLLKMTADILLGVLVLLMGYVSLGAPALAAYFNDTQTKHELGQVFFSLAIVCAGVIITYIMYRKNIRNLRMVYLEYYLIGRAAKYCGNGKTRMRPREYRAVPERQYVICREPRARRKKSRIPKLIFLTGVFLFPALFLSLLIKHGLFPPVVIISVILVSPLLIIAGMVANRALDFKP